MSENTEVQANLKFPKQLKDMLKKEAKKNNRSMTSEVVARLQASLGSDHPADELRPASQAILESAAVRKNFPVILRSRIIQQINRAITMGHEMAFVDFDDLELDAAPMGEVDKIIEELSVWLENAGYKVEWDGAGGCNILFGSEAS